MNAALLPVVDLFRLSTNVFVRALNGLPAEALMVRPSDHSNPLLWMAGHATLFRARLIGLLGGPRETPWGPLFDTGAKVDLSAPYPPVGEIIAVWQELAAQLNQRCGLLTVEALAAPPNARVPTEDGTLHGALAYFAFHEAYHVGQMAYVRKWLGYSPVLG
jgi:hypothetical protein